MKDEEVSSPKLEDVKKAWEGPLSKVYSEVDNMGAGFYHNLTSMMELESSKHILQVGCGRCLMLPSSLTMKNPDATYLATDLSEKMIEFGHQHLKKVFQSYESKLTYEEWLSKSKLTLKDHNCEQPIGCDFKFDRIIANLVLMLTPDPKKAFQALYDQAQQGCVLGVTIWGEPSLNDVHGRLGNIAKSTGVELPKTRPNSHLFNVADTIAEQIGWKTVLKWEQLAVMPYMRPQWFEGYARLASSNMNALSAEQKQWVYQQFMKQMHDLMGEKKPARFPVQMFIFRK